METIKSKSRGPLHDVLEEVIAGQAKEFLLGFHKLHEALDATPHEFINGAGIKNKETGETTIYTLTIKAEPNVSQERLNQYIEESIAIRDKFDKER